MRRRLPPLNALRAFESAGRRGSFALAAEELCVTPAAVSHQVRALEEFLGAALFVRTPSGTEMTPAAARCLPELTRSLDAIAQAMSPFRPAAESDGLTITAGPAFSTQWLVPNLQAFRTLLPGTEVRIVADLDLSDFDRDAVDVAIRFGRSVSVQGLHAEPLLEETVAPLCHPALAASLQGPDGWADCPLIEDRSLKLIDPDAPGWAEWSRAAGVALHGGGARAMSFNQADHALQAAIDGAGVLLGREVLATPALRAGRLVRVGATALRSGLWFHFVCKTSSLRAPGIQAFRGWLIQAMALRTD